MRAIRAARAQLVANPSRIVATVLAVVIGVGFACAALVFTSTFDRDFAHRIGAEYAGADIVVQDAGDQAPDELARRVMAVPGVDDAEPQFDTYVDFQTPVAHGSIAMKSAAANPRLRWATLTDGSWPATSSQVAVSRSAAKAASLAVGSTMTLTTGDGAQYEATVVGIVNGSASTVAGDQMFVLAPAASLTALGVSSAPRIAVIATAGTPVAALQSEIRAALGAAGSAVSVRTAAEQAASDVREYTGQSNTLALVLLTFAAIAMLVAGIVITNTFTILLTQRRRHIALMRCVGATRNQIRREVLAEAAMIGATGSLIGAAVGIAVGWAGASIAGVASGGVALPTVSLVAAVLLGVVITIGAALLPASRAIKVAPLAALRPVADETEGRRSGRLRVTIATALTVGGAGLLAFGVARSSLELAFVGGCLSAIGVLLLMRSLVPLLLSVVGGVARTAGVPGRLAVHNATRNPGRAAATSAALVVGVGLIVMLQVAAASVGASIDKATMDRYPVDIAIAGDGSSLSPGLVSGVAQTPGLVGAIAISGAPAEFSSQSMTWEDDDASAITVLGVPVDAGGVVRGGLSELDSGASLPTVLVPSWWVASGRTALGETITLSTGGRSEEFQVAVGRLTDVGVTSGESFVTTRAALDRLAPHAAPVAIWAAVDENADAAEIVGDLNSVVADQPSLSVTGAVAERGSLQETLGTITTVATGLLAVAVVIAIVGIANTIGLSVAERTRESALLRALGLRRGQLRLMLAIEAGLLAAVGAVVGLVLGLVYGWAGAATTFDDVGRRLVLTVPWAKVCAILAVAVAAGALASVLPARRAVQGMPVEALAED